MGSWALHLDSLVQSIARWLGSEGVPALVVAVAALALAAYQGHATRRHNRLSVRPRLALKWLAPRGDEPFGLHLDNDGLGPGEITCFQARIEGGEWLNLSGEDQVTFTSELRERFGHDIKTSTIEVGSALRVGARFAWLVVLDLEGDKAREVLGEIMRTVGVRYGYKSMYGEKTWYGERDPLNEWLAQPMDGPAGTGNEL